MGARRMSDTETTNETKRQFEGGEARKYMNETHLPGVCNTSAHDTGGREWERSWDAGPTVIIRWEGDRG